MKKKEELYLMIKPIIENVFDIRFKYNHIYMVYNNKIWIRFYKQSINVDGERTLLNTEVEVDLCDDSNIYLKGKYIIKSTDPIVKKLFCGSFFLLKPYLVMGNYELIYNPWYCEERKISYFYMNKIGVFLERVNNQQKKVYKDNNISSGNIKKKKL